MALSPADLMEALLWCAALATWLTLLASVCVEWKRSLPPTSLAKSIRRLVEIGLKAKK